MTRAEPSARAPRGLMKVNRARQALTHSRKDLTASMDTSALVSIQDLLRDHEEQTARMKREAELATKDAKIARLNALHKKGSPVASISPVAVPVPTTSASTTNNAPCTCLDGDPFCDFTRHCTIIKRAN